MCVICIKKMGAKFPTKKSIQNCADSNPDGFAMMWNEDGKVKTYKTLAKKDFMKFYARFIKEHDHKKTSLVIHARIKTHGSLRIENCHCWTALDDSIGFAHNGILSIANRKDMTDSETYFRDIFVPVFEGSARNWAMAERTIEAIISTSKFAFLEGDGTIRHYGHYIKHDGNLYSNSSYEERVYYTSKNSGIGYPYTGKWSSGKWSADYYSEKGYMFINGGRIDQGDISDIRWKLMCNYYYGLMTEDAYCAAVVLTDRQEKGTTEWWMDECEFENNGYKTHSSYFTNKMEWELYIMNKTGKITDANYYKASSMGIGRNWEWEDEDSFDDVRVF